MCDLRKSSHSSRVAYAREEVSYMYNRLNVLLPPFERSLGHLQLLPGFLFNQDLPRDRRARSRQLFHSPSLVKRGRRRVYYFGSDLSSSAAWVQYVKRLSTIVD